MTEGYRKLLIIGNMIPTKGAHCISMGLDMLVMAVFSGAERTEKNGNEILIKAGFDLVQIWTYELGTESLVEAVVA